MEEQVIRTTDFDKLAAKVKGAMEGTHEPAIPIGFERLGKHLCISPRMTYLVAGYTGSGKTTFMEDAFILNPIDWIEGNKLTSKAKLKIIYYSMERSKEFKIAKWALRKMFLDGGPIIPLQRLYKRPGYKPLSDSEYQEFMHYKEYIDGMLESGMVDIFEGPQNPMGIKKYVDDYASKIGKKEKIDDSRSIWIPNDPNLITIVIKDHLGLMKPETREGVRYQTKKEVIDLASGDDRRFRDFYGFTIVNVSQFNREISNPTRLKSGDVEPRLEDLKDSGGPSEDADLVLSLFDPYRYKVGCPVGYDLTQMRDQWGAKKYRYVSILKNSYGNDGVGIGLAFQPAVGTFKELPRITDIVADDYAAVVDDSYFR